MPYTPPAKASPDSSRQSTPTESKPSYLSKATPQSSSHGSASSPARDSSHRMSLPRSNSSQAYLNKARRSPSADTSSAASSYIDATSHQYIYELALNTSLRQSPPPVGGTGVLPPGALVSPPDSTQHSSDDEEPLKQQSRMEELEQAVKALAITQSDLATRNEANNDGSDDSSQPVPGKLTPSARKISHSRSATDSNVQFSASESQTQSNTASDSDDEAYMAQKPPMLRKKSGELVKPAIRPHSRRKVSSMPGTPTYGKKGVHFNDDIAQVRHFLQVDRPSAVSAGGSPVEVFDEDEFPFSESSKKSPGLELRLSNFPRESLERQTQPVRLERLSLSTDQKSLIGVIAVANISFHKSVVARFTFDFWKTTSEVNAEYNNDLRAQPLTDGYDQFNFTIKLSDQAAVDKKTLLLCVRYQVNGQEFWDNNGDMNFQAEFVPRQRLTLPKTDMSPLGARPIPRSRHNSASSRHRSVDTLDDDFATAFDTTTPFQFRRIPTGRRAPDSTPPRRQHHSNQAFGSRYDFSASLTAALTHAQAQIAGRSLPERQPPANTSNPQQLVAPSTRAPGTESPRPTDLISNTQPLDSRAYQEFVSKFCFAGTKKAMQGVATSSPPLSGLNSSRDGAQDIHHSPESATAQDSQVGNPSPADNTKTSWNGFFGAPSPQNNSESSANASPMPMTGHVHGTESPPAVSFGYPYNHSSRSVGFFAESHTPPPAIQG